MLPPLPGESRPPETTTEAATQDDPAATTADPSPVAAPTGSEDGAFSIPETAAPPQPKVSGPAPGSAVDPPDSTEPKSPAAPRIGPEPSSPEDSATVFRFPPPTRPPYRGTGLFIGAGVAFAIAVTEQIIAHRLIKRRCIDPVGRGDFDTETEDDVSETGEDIGEIVTGCAPGVLPALALRIHSDLGLLTAIGLATAGGMTRANHDAYGDVFDPPGRRRKVAGFRIAGISLIGAGLASWLTTSASAWAVIGNCSTARCVNGGRLMAFITRDVSAAMVASGGAMLGFAEAYRRRHNGYTRDRALSLSPAMSRQSAGFRIAGRF